MTDPGISSAVSGVVLTEGRAREIAREEIAASRAPAVKKGKSALSCNFCGKKGDEVLVLIAGPLVLICDECVDLCAAIVGRRRAEQADTSHAELGPGKHSK